MATQPCDKCGITVDPELQKECPNCGRVIRLASTLPPPPPPPPPPEEDPGWWGNAAGDTTIPPPPQQAPPSRPRAGGFLGGIGARIVIGLLILGGVGAWNAFTSADRDDTGAIVDEGDVAAIELAVGDCLLDPGEGVFEEVKGVPCSQRHDFEVFHVARLSGGAYPTDAQFEDIAVDECLPAFAPYTGEDFETSDLWIGYFIPDATAWDSGDRTMQCYLYLPDRQLSRSRSTG